MTCLTIKRFILIFIAGTLLCLPEIGYSQKKTQNFDYGRKGKDHGTVSIECFLESDGGRNKKPLQEVAGGEIYLEDLKGEVFFRVRFSNLVLGLKANYQDSKKSDHNLAYSLEIPANNVAQSSKGVSTQEAGAKRINPSNNDYQTSVDLLYRIDRELIEEATGFLKFKYFIVGKSGVVSGDNWECGTVSFSYSIIPSTSFVKKKELNEREELAYNEIIAASSKPNVQRQLCENYIKTFSGFNPERMEKITTIAENLSGSSVEKETESSFWTKRVLPAVESGNQSEIIKSCKDYRDKYKYDNNYIACLKILITNLPEGSEKDGVIKSWENLTNKTYKVKKDKEVKKSSKEDRKKTIYYPKDYTPKPISKIKSQEVDTISNVEVLDNYISGLPVGYETPTAEMKLVSDGIVIQNAKGGEPPYIIRISSSKGGGFEFVNEFEGENYKISFNGDLANYAGNKWLRLDDERNTEMARLDNITIKHSMDLTWIYVGSLGVFCFLGYLTYKKYFLV